MQLCPQATAMKLQQEKHELELEVQDAEWRVDQGQAPNVRAALHAEAVTGVSQFVVPRQEEAEIEWGRQLREVAYRRDVDERQLQQQPVATDAFAPAQITRTTAEPRPNAYIPDDIGIPKPYGASMHQLTSPLRRSSCSLINARWSFMRPRTDAKLFHRVAQVPWHRSSLQHQDGGCRTCGLRGHSRSKYDSSFYPSTSMIGFASCTEFANLAVQYRYCRGTRTS